MLLQCLSANVTDPDELDESVTYVWTGRRCSEPEVDVVSGARIAVPDPGQFSSVSGPLHSISALPKLSSHFTLNTTPHAFARRPQIRRLR